jgi:hypothetical protein
MMGDDYGMDDGPISSYMPKKLVIYYFFDSSSENMIIANVNCNNHLLHIDEMSIRFEGSGVDVVGVNDTFLTQSVSSMTVEIVRYRLLRNDESVYGRPETGGGGVGLYLKSYLKNRLVAETYQVGVEHRCPKYDSFSSKP